MKVKIQNITLLILYIAQAVIFLVHGIEGGKAVGAGLACVEAIILLFSSRSSKESIFFKIFFDSSSFRGELKKVKDELSSYYMEANMELILKNM